MKGTPGVRGSRYTAGWAGESGWFAYGASSAVHLFIFLFVWLGAFSAPAPIVSRIHSVELVELPVAVPVTKRPERPAPAAVAPPLPEKEAEKSLPERERRPEKVTEPKLPPARQPRIPDIKRLPERKESARVTAKAEGPLEPAKKPEEAAVAKPPAVAEAPPAPADAGQQVAALPTVEAQVELPDFRFPFYLKLIQGKISNGWTPPAADSRLEAREVIVTFDLARTGKISNVSVRNSSGNPFFDQAALRAVYLADPLPKFPDGLTESELRIHFSFVLTRKG